MTEATKRLLSGEMPGRFTSLNEYSRKEDDEEQVGDHLECTAVLQRRERVRV